MSALPPGFVLDSAPQQAGPVYGPPPKAPAPADPLVQRQRELAIAKAERDLANGGTDNKAPSGYRYRADGTLEPIPGGPADPGRTGSGSAGDAVPVSMFNTIDPQVGIYTAYQGALGSFQDDYGGNLFGGLENMAQGLAGDAAGTPGQRDWWANFQRTDNQVRNQLFGATLTPSEQQAYLSTTITPRMDPSEIRTNLESRTKLLRAALERQRAFLLANGYKADAVDALFAPILAQQQQLLAGAQAEDQQDQDAPPALIGTAGGGEPPQNIPGAPNSGNTLVGPGGGTRTVEDPTMAGIRQRYAEMLQANASAGELVQFLKSMGVEDPAVLRQAAQQAAYRRRNPNVPISEYSISSTMEVPLSVGERAMNNMAQAALGPAAISAADAASGFNLDSVVGMVGGNAERTRLAMDQIAQANPGSSMLGTLVGGTGAALGGEVALGAAGVGSGIGRALAADSLYGMVAGAGMADTGADGAPATLADRGMGAIKGGLAGLAGSYAGQKIGSGMQAFARGVSDPSVRAMQDAGVTNMTLGQMVGNSGRVGAMVKGAEDRVAGLPVVGEIVNARRREGMTQFNSRAFDQALKPIGGTVGEKFGEEAVDAAQAQVSDAFERALGGKVVTADGAFANDLTGATTRVMALPRVGEEVADGVRTILEPYMRGNSIDGRTMQQISRELRDLKASYKTDPLKKRIGDAIDAVEESIFGMFKRQAPEVLPEYNKAKDAARRLYILEDAVLRARNSPEGGQAMFTPGQLGMADRANTKKYGGASAAARGDTPFFDYQRAAQETLPNEVPDSGTVGRLALPALGFGIVGADAATGEGPSATGTALGLALAGAYTKAGQRILTKGARGMKPGTRRRAIAESNKTKRAIGAAAAASSAALTTQQQ